MTDIVPPQARKASSVATAPGYVPPYFEYIANDGIDLFEYARRLSGQWRFISAITALITSVALTAALTAPAVYRSEALLAPVSTTKSEGLGSLIGQLGDLSTLVETYVGSGKDRTTEAIATLKSRSLAINFINEQNLKPALFPDRWNPIAKQWREPQRAPTDLEAYEVFEEIRHVSVDRRTGLVTLAVEWGDPRLAATWANALAKQVNARRRAEAVNEARSSIEYLERQLAKNNAIEIQQAIYRLIEVQTKTITVASTREEYAFRIIDPAVAPERRIRPKRLAMTASGFCLGLVIAVGLALFRQAWTKPDVPTP